MYITIVARTNRGVIETGERAMTNRNSLLGHSRPREKLSRAEIIALDNLTKPQPASTAAKPQKVTVKASALNWRWTVACPACGFKVSGRRGTPSQGACSLGVEHAGGPSTWRDRRQLMTTTTRPRVRHLPQGYVHRPGVVMVVADVTPHTLLANMIGTGRSRFLSLSFHTSPPQQCDLLVCDQSGTEVPDDLSHPLTSRTNCR